ncbi:DUF6325 family protein [Glutamicibacter sp.]|uniref:DUF6325 family protein n=1 Tax=Glutamicibacter sp. TaxID=1931995 RepID=UPI0028BDF7B7|nr:DUF6325 family protein [Glutamicibacter sp.]
MKVGPVEVLVCTFPRLKVEKLFLEALEETVETGAIALIDLVLVQKDAEGNLQFRDLERGLPEHWARMIIDPRPMILFSQQDMDLIASSLNNNNCAIAIAVEHRWSRRLSSVAMSVGGGTQLQTSIPHSDVVKAFKSDGVAAN